MSASLSLAAGGPWGDVLLIGHICLEKLGRTQQHGCDSAPTELHGQRLYLALPGKGRYSVVLFPSGDA